MNAAQIQRAAHGTLLWEELHLYAYNYAWPAPREATAAEQRDAREWLAAWSERIPRFGCKCRHEWSRILQIAEPPLDTATSFYWWTVAAHDRINRKLHKPLACPAWSPNHPLLLSP